MLVTASMARPRTRGSRSLAACALLAGAVGALAKPLVVSPLVRNANGGYFSASNCNAAESSVLVLNSLGVTPDPLVLQNGLVTLNYTLAFTVNQLVEAPIQARGRRCMRAPKPPDVRCLLCTAAPGCGAAAPPLRPAAALAAVCGGDRAGRRARFRGLLHVHRRLHARATARRLPCVLRGRGRALWLSADTRQLCRERCRNAAGAHAVLAHLGACIRVLSACCATAHQGGTPWWLARPVPPRTKSPDRR